MDSIDAANSFIKKYDVKVSQTEITNIIRQEVDQLIEYHKGKRIRYETHVQTAFENICRWYELACTFKLTLNWTDLRQFAGSSRIACLWATFLGYETQ